MSIRHWTAISILLNVVVILLSSQNPPPQGGQRTLMRFDAESSVMLREVMVIVGEEKGKLAVMMIPPADRRPDGTPEVDLQRGDEVGMVGGKRVASLKELRTAYEAIKPGQEFKMGVRRNGRAIVVTFIRKEEKEMAGGGMTVMRRGPGDETSAFFPALGLGLEKKGSGVIVSETLPHAFKEIQKGDVVSTLNGSDVRNIADFTKALDATKVGDKLDFEFLRKGKKISISFPRPEPSSEMRIVR